MSTHNICFRREIRKIICGYPLLSVAMCLCSVHQHVLHFSVLQLNFDESNIFRTIKICLRVE